MMMKGKWMPHIIAVTALVVFVVLGLACGTLPDPGPAPTYKIHTKPVADGFLKGKKAVIFNLEIVSRESASLMEKQGSGGIFSVIQAGARLVTLGTFNSRAKKFDEANADDLKEAFTIFDQIISSAWQKAYGAETAQLAYNFGRTARKINYFNAPTSAIKKEIAGVCASNNAELAVTIIQRITHGYLNESTLTAPTHIVAEICVFDSKGNIVIRATAKLPDITSAMYTGFNCSPNNADQYVELYLGGLANILMTILAFDSAADFSVDDLMKDGVMKLVTTSDDDE